MQQGSRRGGKLPHSGTSSLHGSACRGAPPHRPRGWRYAALRREPLWLPRRTDIATRGSTLLCKDLGPVRRLAHSPDGLRLWAASEGAGLTAWPGPAAAAAPTGDVWGSGAGGAAALSPKRPHRQSPQGKAPMGSAAGAFVPRHGSLPNARGTPWLHPAAIGSQFQCGSCFWGICNTHEGGRRLCLPLIWFTGIGTLL